MRRIYSSPRIENVERLVAVMAEHGIATKVTNRRAYDSKSYKQFSYARPGHSDDWPAVWVKHAGDHTRARQLMREIGIEPVTRYAEELAAYRFQKNGGRSPANVAARVRTAVLVAVAIAVAIYGAKLISVW
ncbi:MAG: hypothetical protein OJF61_000915 [Rhodanobacteraceae bacterium]|jgi:hypothetical protein|nr:MAG: hypothetical protein OJF61_000915 [Rhodanobacteraceae bacterium]